MLKAESFEKVYKIVDALNFEVGIEIFSMFHVEGYKDLLKKNLDKLKNYKITFHEPYYKTDHTSLEGEVFERSEKYFQDMLEFRELNPKYIVYHYNNIKINDREKMLDAARKNLDRLSQMTDIPLLIENVGIMERNNALLNEDEFIKECLNRKENVLIDIGHANANSWDMENLLSSLKDKIVSYHLHTNDGKGDQHMSIFEENKTPDMKSLIPLIKKYTPKADLVIEYSNFYEDKEARVVEDIKALNALL